MAKRVLEIINLPGSARNFIGGQFGYLREHGYEMHLICTDDEQMRPFARRYGVHYHPVPLARMLRPAADLRALLDIWRYIRRHRIDTVIAHQAKARLLGTVAAFLARVPNRIIFAHGVLFETLRGPKRRLVIAMDRLVAALSHKTVCVSRSVAEVRRRYGIERADRQYMLGEGTCGGIDTVGKFNPELLSTAEMATLRASLGVEEADFVVGFCGRIVRDKGVAELVEGFRRFKRRVGDDTRIKLMVIGRYEERDAVSASLREQIEGSDDIIHIPYVDNDIIARYFTHFSVMVLPSYREGFGMVTVECGAMGVPAVVSRATGCIDSICEGVTGLYCDITPASIADALERLYADPAMLRQMGANARRYVQQHYDCSVVWPHLINVIEA